MESLIMNNPRVLVATLLCDRKKYSQNIALPAIYDLDYDNYDVYINCQTDYPFNETTKELVIDDDAPFSSHYHQWEPTLRLMRANPDRTTLIDCWQIHNSSWWKKPSFDQDQARLFPICIARNMARDCALLGNYDYIFFIDADVIPDRNSLKQLLSHNKTLISGEVPGRGEHSHAKYIFHVKGMDSNGLLRTLHATCGYTLIKKELFSMLPFRFGPSPVPDQNGVIHFLSEDPAYGADAIYVWKKDFLNTPLDRAGLPLDTLCDGWWVDTKCKSRHEDNPDQPLTNKDGAQF